MTYATSLEERISNQIGELDSLLEGHGIVTAKRSSSSSWSALEILLHLIGATADVVDGLRRALNENEPRITREQQGGAYVGNASRRSKDELLHTLVGHLEAIANAVRALSDEALSRPVTISGAGIEPTARVPVGLWIRDAVGDHFDVHVKQLRETIARAPGP